MGQYCGTVGRVDLESPMPDIGVKILGSIGRVVYPGYCAVYSSILSIAGTVPLILICTTLHP